MSEIERLEGHVRLLKRIIERLPLCPDHRDKVRDVCWLVRDGAAAATNIRLWRHEGGGDELVRVIDALREETCSESGR
jgi:hypothetical protein